MPEPGENENRDDFISRCIPIVIEDGTAEDGKQGAAICNSMWEEAHKSTETVVYNGGAVKALGNGLVGGYLVRFTGPDEPDLEGEYFDAKTRFGTATDSAVYYSHGLDSMLGLRELGTGRLEAKDAGVWIQAQLELRDEYEKAIYQLAQQGKLGWSSGTAPHLVEREQTEKAIHITRWPLGLDASLTPIPADPGNRALPLKAWAKSLKNLQVQLEGAGDAPVSTTVDEAAHVVMDNQMPRERATMEVKTMSEETQPEERLDWQDRLEKIEQMLAGKSADMEALEGKVTDQLTKVLSALEKSPALKDAGYLSPDSEGQERQAQKSFADWLLAVRNNNASRLKSVYGSVKALGEQSGTTGGYLVPEEFINTLMMAAMEGAVVRPLATVIQVGTNRGSVPSLSHGAPSAAGKGYSAFAGGVNAYWTAEAGTLTSTDPAFEEIEYNINKLGGYTQVSNELIADSAMGIESLLSALFGRAIQAKEEYAFLRGIGAGEPLGIFEAPCTQAVTTNADNTFAAIDAMNMLAHFQQVSGKPNSVTWVLHRGVIPDFYANMDVSQSGVDWVQPREGLPGTLLGWPMRFSEHMPAPNTDDVLLADMGAYLIFDRKGLEIGYSEHAAFTSDQGTWRFIKRLDGQPWLSEVITLADPGGAYYVSPFCYHDD